eukprot:SAG22_NODE_265_length_13348_cov_150.719149_8_plen_59_part_00
MGSAGCTSPEPHGPGELPGTEAFWGLGHALATPTGTPCQPCVRLYGCTAVQLYSCTAC